MGLFRRKNYYDIGRNGTIEQFLKACKKTDNYVDNYRKKEKRMALYDGAVQALVEGRPDNVQACATSPTVIFKILQKSNDEVTDLKLAVKNIPEDEKQGMFTEAIRLILTERTGREALLPLLFQSGAEARPFTLYVAAAYSSPVAVQHVHEAGVSFEEAILQAEHYRDEETLNALKFYQESMDKPPVEEISPRAQAIIDDLRQQVDELTRRLERQSRASRYPASVLSRRAKEPATP